MTRPAARQDGAPTTLPWLCHPTTVLALVLLLVNDHVLKPATYPSLPQVAASDPPYPHAPYPSRPPVEPDSPAPVQLRPPYPSQLPPG
ncbi:hypothetical protein AB0A95_11955 [Micromonospora sp. NPDC049230]|uniref:hypothetical protein n=1 Tax=Micromonospora sp. NPDC049230 TaxID=3155502 RepID=UPI0033E747CB